MIGIQLWKKCNEVDKINWRQAEELCNNGLLLPTLERQKVRLTVARIVSSFGFCVYIYSDIKIYDSVDCKIYLRKAKEAYYEEKKT